MLFTEYITMQELQRIDINGTLRTLEHTDVYSGLGELQHTDLCSAHKELRHIDLQRVSCRELTLMYIVHPGGNTAY